MVRRGGFILATSAACAAAASTLHALAASGASGPNSGVVAAAPLRELERRSGGRLGVYAYSVGARDVFVAYRALERFPMCSTFKAVAVGAILARVDAGTERLGRRIGFGRRDLLDYAPVTRAHLRDGSLTVEQLCAAAIVWSDNTAANLLLRALGGPAQVTRFARAIGDPMLRLDRTEPTLNTALPGDPRDTTSPRAMARTLATLTFGSTLTPNSRIRLTAWLDACRTGTTRLRAGLPLGWRIGDKTGTGKRGTANDIAIARPPAHAPIVITAYLTGATVASDARNGILAEVGRIVGRAFA